LKTGAAGLCGSASFNPTGKLPFECVDGDVLVATFGILPPDHCVPFEAGLLFCKNDASDLVRYADDTPFTCDPLPEPTDCPIIPDVRLCGPGCGGCGLNETCRGRSPTHPHSLCLPLDGLLTCGPSMPCSTGMGCFSFLATPDTQADADANGSCLPLAACQAAASQLPGGGKCVPGS
jgi:hypothetical protein